MPIEHKFTDLKDLTVSEAGPGIIEGYRSVFSEIDEGGDIVLKGAFADCLSEYLASGFSAHSHDWKFTEAVGYPLEAYEDEHGWFVKSEFHTTQTAQDARTIAIERKKAGKTVGFSFGYIPLEYEYIDAKDYKEKLPLYIKSDRLNLNLTKAQQFDRIRLLKKVEAPEDSLVLAGMNKLATATAVKSDPQKITLSVEVNDKRNGVAAPAQVAKPEAQDESKGMLAEEMAQTTPSIWEVESAFHRVVRKIAETAKDASVTGAVLDWRATVTDLVGEYGPQILPIVVGQIEEFLDSTDDEFYLKGITGTESFESFEAAGTELKKFAQKMRSNHEIRTKEGRVLSSSNRAKVQTCLDSMAAVTADLTDLMAMSEPKPKETEKETAIAVATLRTQSLRLESKILLSRLQTLKE